MYDRADPALADGPAGLNGVDRLECNLDQLVELLGGSSDVNQNLRKAIAKLMPSGIPVLVVFSPGSSAAKTPPQEVLRREADCLQKLRQQWQRGEKQALSEVLRRTGGNLSRAARMLGKSRGAIRYQARKHGFI